MYQTTSDLDRFLNGHIRRNPNFRLSSIFRTIHKSNHINLIGSYPLLTSIVEMSKSKGRKFSRNEIRHAINQSEDFRGLIKKEKTELINDLFLRSHQVSFTIEDSDENVKDNGQKERK